MWFLYIGIIMIFRFYIPYFVFLSVVLNVILNYYGIPYVYMLFILLGIVGMLVNGIYYSKNSKNILLFTYILILLLIFTIQLFFYENWIDGMKSVLQYITLIIYWFIYFQKFSLDDFKLILIKTIPLVYVVAILASIQYFFSPTLFGLIPSDSNALQWAQGLTFSEYHTFFRAFSILGSPQIFGLFIAFYIIIIINIKNKIKNTDKFGIIFLIFSGILSGDKSFLFILILYFIYKFFKSNPKKRAKWISVAFFIICVAILSIFKNTINTYRIIDRVVNAHQIVQQEKIDGRLDRYKMVLHGSSNLLIGNGLGSQLYSKEKQATVVAESYFVQMIFGAGLFVFLSFSMLLLGSYVFANRQFLLDIRMLLFLMFLSMTFVQTFNSPVFFIFWGVIISSYGIKNNSKNIKKIRAM